MKGPLSLEQELRATRKVKGPKNTNWSSRTPDPKETERPWQPDIERMQQTMREVLRAIANFSGVELPGLPPGLQDDGALLPRLDIKTLKDRFRNELEGFSIKTTEELTKRAKEQTHAALDAIHNEVGGRIDQVAAEFREKLQDPAQIEKLVEPRIDEAATRLDRSLSQKVEQLVAEHEQLVRDMLQGALSSVQAQISALEQTVQQISELKTDSAAHLSAEQSSVAEVNGRIDQIATQVQEQLQHQVQIEKLLEPRVDEAAARLEKSLCQKVENLIAEHEQLVQERLQGTVSSFQAQISTLEQTVQQIRELRADSAAHLSVERPTGAEVAGRIDQIAAEVREKLQDQVQIEKLLEPRVEEAAARLEGSLSQKVEQLIAEHEQLVQQRLRGTVSSFQAQISTLEQTVQQIRELKAESIAPLPAERPTAAADNAMKEPESSQNSGLKGFLDQAFSRIESSFDNFPETPKMQITQSTVAGPEEQHEAKPLNDLDKERRVQEALDKLGRLGTKNPHPDSKG
jgi:hypothetical protein